MDEIISYTMCAVKVRNAKLRNYLKRNFTIVFTLIVFYPSSSVSLPPNYITVNRNRMVRLAGPCDKYVIVLSLLTSRDEIRGRLLWKLFRRYIVDVVCASNFRHCLT
jgi:hypothetical protein